ncbi:transcription factor TFIID complex protein [Malassezia pachydermatis]
MAGVSSYAPPAGVISDLAQTDARDVMGRMIAYRTQKAGFAGARRQAMERMEELVDTFMETLLQSCAQFSELANRHDPTLHDVLHTFELLGVNLAELAEFSQQTQKEETRAEIAVATPREGTEAWEDPSRHFLPCREKEEQEEASTWSTLMHDIVPNHLPAEPPRHCWMSTPVYATEVLSEMPVLQLVNRKLENARLVETSLRQLIKNTDAAAPAKVWIPSEPGTTSKDAILPTSEAMDEDETRASAPAQPFDGWNAPSTEPGVAHENKRGVLPRAVNYKASWYASLSSNDSKLPMANLYTARLRGNVDDPPRRYVVK